MQKRYKYKLDMLEPGAKICKGIGFGIMISIIFWIVGWNLIAIIIEGIVAIMVILLIVLLAIEFHQDKVLYQDAKKEDPDIK